MDVVRRQTPDEERLNVLTHGLGAAVAVVVLIWLVSRTAGRGPVALGSAWIYGVSLVGVLGASATYHAASGWWKDQLRTLDYCSIYAFIAGTYTPFAAVMLGGVWGNVLLVLVWSLAVAGIVMELSTPVRWERAALGIYLCMGWSCLMVASPFLQVISAGALALLAVGGAIYTVGVFFYVRNGPFDHVIWHLFVLGGAALHAAAVLLYVL
ncbi:MAG: hemolysin III family protein [Myxococcales bacterium]|nr:hemolysin III family protein [Myxococcales bacterium]